MPCSRYRSREAAREALRVVAVASSLQLGACSFDIPSLIAPATDEMTTGSIGPAREIRLIPAMGDEDWRRARGSLAIALDLHGNGRAVRWDNAETGRHGVVVPAGPPGVDEHEVCRDFDASVTVVEGAPVHLTGRACKVSDEWLIRSVTPRKI